MVQKWMRNLSKQHSKLIYLFSFLIVFSFLLLVSVDVAKAQQVIPTSIEYGTLYTFNTGDMFEVAGKTYTVTQNNFQMQVADSSSLSLIITNRLADNTIAFTAAGTGTATSAPAGTGTTASAATLPTAVPATTSTTITGTLQNRPQTYNGGALVLGPDNQVYTVAEGQTLTTHPTAPRNSGSAYIDGLIQEGILQDTVYSLDSLTSEQQASVLMTSESYDTTTNNIVTSTASAAAGTPGSTSASGSTPSQTKKNNRAERTPANWSALWTGASGLQLFNSLLAVGSGPSTVNSLLYDEDKQAEVKNKAREIMNEYFDMYRLSLWIDEWLCTSNIPRLPAGTAVAMSETGESLEITVHVSGERSFFTMYNETNVTTGDVTASLKYFYKLSTTVSNKFFENKTIKFNVYLGTASNQLQTKLYNNTVELNRGETFTISYGSSLHPDPVSDSYYNRICISFTENPPSVGSTINPITIRNPFCNVIEAVTTTSTSYVRPSYLDSSSSSSGSSGSAGTTTQSPNQI
jgi:hypothetical protein